VRGLTRIESNRRRSLFSLSLTAVTVQAWYGSPVQTQIAAHN
jgi:hypothetical protein